jgi:4'-phosphopantetheinyl transferase
MRPSTVQLGESEQIDEVQGSQSEPLRLGPSDVAVWRADLDDVTAAEFDILQSKLARNETERARRFIFERDARRFIVGRGILRLLLGRYVDRDAAELAFRYGPNGKPALACEGAPNVVHFNLAHSDGLALYAFTRVSEVGIDVERIRDLPDWLRVAEAVFSPHELAQLRACPPERQRDEFFCAWTRQEAVLKALGTGLGGTTTKASSGVSENNGDAGAGEAAFSVHPLIPAPGFAGALAAAPAGRWTTIHTWLHDGRHNSRQTLRQSPKVQRNPITANGAKFS